jgi:energy-coupling factor transporter ATP-binding protein EcfA2
VFETLTAREYLELVAALHAIPRPQVEERIQRFLTFFDLSDAEARSASLSTFSKGMRQKVVISAALLHNPSVVFFDEPLNGLDANAALLFKTLVTSLAREGKTVVWCSHILDVVERICERVVIVHQGACWRTAPFRNPATLAHRVVGVGLQPAHEHPQSAPARGGHGAYPDAVSAPAEPRIDGRQLKALLRAYFIISTRAMPVGITGAKRMRTLPIVLGIYGLLGLVFGVMAPLFPGVRLRVARAHDDAVHRGHAGAQRSVRSPVQLARRRRLELPSGQRGRR